MYCTNCGSEVNDGAKFCSECGASLAGNNATAIKAQTDNDFTRFLVYTCNSVRFDELERACIETGEPSISSDSWRLKNARKNFRIPDKEDVYLILNATDDDGDDIGRGLAICTNGIYYCGSSDRISFLNWQNFRNKLISLYNDSISIGGESFDVGFGAKKVVMILKNIQDYMS